MPIPHRSIKIEAANGHADRRLGARRIVSLGARSLASIADQGAAAAISFLSSVFVGRLLGAEALGIFAMTSVLVMAIRQAQAGAVLDPMSVFGPRRAAPEKRRYLGFVAGLHAIWVGGVTLIAAATAATFWFQSLIDDANFHAIIASLLFANVVAFQYLIRRHFYVEEAPQRALLQSVAFLALCLLAFGVYAATTAVTVVGTYLVLAACSLAVCLVQGQAFLAQAGLPDRSERRCYLGEHWRFGSWTLLTVPLSLVCYQAYFLVSGGVLTVEEAGYLKAADALIAPFSQVAIGVSLMFVPIAARRLDAMGRSTQIRYTLHLCAATLGIAAAYAVAVFLFGTQLIDLIFGRHLAAAGEVIQIMAVVPLFIAAGVPAGIMLAARRRPDLRFAAYAFASLASVLVGFPLVRRIGIDGAAWGLIVSQAALAIGLWITLICRWKIVFRGTPRLSDR